MAGLIPNCWRGDERRVELYDGDLVEITAPKLIQQEVLPRLVIALEPWAEPHNAGEIYVAPHDLYISERKFFEPDISFVRRERFAEERIEREDDAGQVAPPAEMFAPSLLGGLHISLKSLFKR